MTDKYQLVIGKFDIVPILAIVVYVGGLFGSFHVNKWIVAYILKNEKK